MYFETVLICAGIAIASLFLFNTRNVKENFDYKNETLPYLNYNERVIGESINNRYKRDLLVKLKELGLIKNLIDVSDFYDIKWYQTLDKKWTIYKFKTRAYSINAYSVEFQIYVVNNKIEEISIII